jgi:hypothetical protein
MHAQVHFEKGKVEKDIKQEYIYLQRGTMLLVNFIVAYVEIT